MSNKNARAQQNAVDQVLEDMLEWYASETQGKVPDHIAKDTVTKNGKKQVLRWLEPLVPGVDNPMLVEEQLGDYWTIRLERIQLKIQVGGG